MAEVAVKDIQRLRHEAGVGMMDAKRALHDADGDFERAFELLREKGLAAAAKREGREANEGAIGSYLHLQNERVVLGTLVELACETDFVAKSPEFAQAANDIAMHVSWGNPTWVRREEVDEAVLDKERDLIEREARAAGKPEQAIPKIVEGRLERFYQDHVLYDQGFVNKEAFDGTVGEMVARLAARMGENVSVRRVCRLKVGGEG